MFTQRSTVELGEPRRYVTTVLTPAFVEDEPITRVLPGQSTTRVYPPRGVLPPHQAGWFGRSAAIDDDAQPRGAERRKNAATDTPVDRDNAPGATGPHE
jgi:hypothetical protein